MLAILIFHTQSVILGVDIGSDHLRASYLSSNTGVEYLQSKDGNRVFKTHITIVPKNGTVPPIIMADKSGEYEYYINDEPMERRYPSTTLSYWGHLLAAAKDSEFIQKMESRAILPSYSIAENNRYVFAGIFPEVGLFRGLAIVNESLQHAMNNVTVQRTVFVVPKFSVQQYRNSIRFVAHRQGHTPYVIDSSRAASSMYGIMFGKNLAKRSTNILFFDFGATTLQLTLTQFNKTKNTTIAQEIYYDYSDTLGGRDFDVLIANFLQKQYGKEVTPKQYKTLIDEAERIKIRLTTDHTVNGHIDILGLTYDVSQEDFINEAQPLLKEVDDLLRAIPYRIDKVQMLGGSSRIPIIHKIVEKATNVTRLSFSMNAEEANALGASYVGALISPDFKVPDFEYIPLDIYSFFIMNRSHTDTLDHINNFFRQDIWIYQTATKFPSGSSPFCAWNMYDEGTNFTKTEDGLYRLKRRKLGLHQWNYFALTFSLAIDKFIKAKEELDAQVNIFEESLLDIKQSLLDERLDKHATEAEIKTLNRTFVTYEKWFMSQKKYEVESLKKKLKEMRGYAGEVMSRMKNLDNLDNALLFAEKVFGMFEKHILDHWQFRSQRPSRTDIRILLRQYVQLRYWLENIKELQELRNEKENPILYHFDVTRKINKFYDRFQKLKQGISLYDEKTAVQGDTFTGNQQSIIY